jgi:hypothetical protein
MKNILLLILGASLLTGCRTLIPYTSDLRVENQWSQNDLKRIQFYVSQPIVLQRQLRSNETNIVSGKIKTVDGRQVQEIIIRKGTRGVVTAFPDDYRMAVSFEISDQHFLTFGVDPKRGNRFYLRLADFRPNEFARVTYYGETYDLSPSSLNAHLQINQKRINQLSKNMRVAKGRKVR